MSDRDQSLLVEFRTRYEQRRQEVETRVQTIYDDPLSEDFNPYTARMLFALTPLIVVIGIVLAFFARFRRSSS